MIVQFPCHQFVRLSVTPLGITEAFGAHGVAHDPTAGVLAERGFFPWTLWIVEKRHHATAFQMRGNCQPASLAEGRIDIDVFGQGTGLSAGGFHAGHAENHRHVGVELEVGVLAPAGVLAQLPAVVAPEDDYGLIAEIEPVEFIEQPADLGIDV